MIEDPKVMKEILTALSGAGGGGGLVVLVLYIWGRVEDWKKSKDNIEPPNPYVEMHKTHTEIFLRLNSIEIALPSFVKKEDLEKMRDTLTNEIRTVGREISQELHSFIRKEDIPDKVKSITGELINNHMNTCPNKKAGL